MIFALTTHSPLGQGVTETALDVLSCFLDCPEGRLEVSDIVNGVKNAEDVQTAFTSIEAEFSYDVVRIIPVSDDVLTSKEHLELRIGHVMLEKS